MTQKEIVLDTIKYYTNHPRSMNEGANECLYKGPNDSICAFARVIKPEYRNLLEEGSSAGERMKHFDNDKVQLFLPEYSGHDKEFWNIVQGIHDTALFWEPGKFIISRARFSFLIHINALLQQLNITQEVIDEYCAVE